MQEKALTHHESGTVPWNPVREKKQECGPNCEEKKMVLAKTKVLKKMRPCSRTVCLSYVLTFSSAWPQSLTLLSYDPPASR